MASSSVYIHFLVDKQYSYFIELQVVRSSKTAAELCTIKTPNKPRAWLKHKRKKEKGGAWDAWLRNRWGSKWLKSNWTHFDMF